MPLMRTLTWSFPAGALEDRLSPKAPALPAIVFGNRAQTAK